VLAGCGTDASDDPMPEPVEEPDEGTPEPDVPDPDDGPVTDPAPEDDAPVEGDTGDAPAGAEDPDAATAAPLSTDPTTELSERDPDGTRLSVTDVRIGTHDGFDRVVFELVGEGETGWFVQYVDEPRSQGSGASIDVAGDAFLAVAVRGILLPPDAPEDHDRWETERLPGPDGGVVLEVVDDNVFEGQRLFHVGLADELPYRILRYEDPERIVIDVLHDG
jgi:hypothetical protein